jgi:RND family efflux transporter MFP subunit
VNQSSAVRYAAIFAALTVSAATLAGCGRSAAQTHTSSRSPVRAADASGSGIPVELIAVQSLSSPDKVRISGQVTAWRTATVAAEVAEQVRVLPIEVGQSVPAGGLLAQLNDDTARATLAEAEAGWAQATAARRQMEAEYARAVVETRASIDAARAQIVGSDAGIRQARAQATQASEQERKARAATRSQELAQAEAALRRAQADETLAKTDLDRYTNLVREGAVAQQVLDRAKATYESAKANRETAEQAVSLAREGARQEDIAAATAGVVQADAAIAAVAARRKEAEAALAAAGTRDARLTALRRQIDGLKAQEARSAATVRQARLLVEKHRIGAPFAGRVLAKLTEVGEMLGAGTPIARIGEIGRVKATFAVPEADRRGLSVGQSVTLTADALLARTFTGTIRTVGYQADPRTRTFPIEVEITNPREVLLPNMVVRLPLSHRGRASALTIPISAVASDGTTSHVFTVANGKAVRRAVTLGAVSGDRVAVTSGLAEGERIVAAPQRLTDGATVRVTGR